MLTTLLLKWRHFSTSMKMNTKKSRLIITMIFNSRFVEMFSKYNFLFKIMSTKGYNQFMNEREVNEKECEVNYFESESFEEELKSFDNLIPESRIDYLPP